MTRTLGIFFRGLSFASLIPLMCLSAPGCIDHHRCADIGEFDFGFDIPSDAGPDSAADLPWDIPDTSTEPGPFEWPVPTEVVDLEPSADWKNTVHFPDDPFLGGTGYTGYITEVPRWVKFVVLMKDPDKVYFQDSQKYVFHYDFARNWIEPFNQMTADEFDLATLYEEGQQLILGAALFAPGGSPTEVGIQLVRQDSYHPEMVKRVWDAVTKSIILDAPATSKQKSPTPREGTPGASIDFFYFPTFEQHDSAMRFKEWYELHGIRISSVDRWADGDQCYSNGWAVGRLVEIPGDQIDSAYVSGMLLPTDILLTDAVPAEVPFVAGIISTTASTPNSHVAILSTSLNIPFVWLADDTQVDFARSLAGKRVAMWTAGFNIENNACSVNLVDATAITDDDLGALLASRLPKPLDFKAKQPIAFYTGNPDDLTPADIVHFGGKAANYGVLRKAIPTYTPEALAISFKLYDDLMAQPFGDGTLGQAINAKLAPHASWPPDMTALDADLATVRDMIRNTPLPDSADRILTALNSWSSTRKIRFRSSTNVEDASDFVGAGLYDSYSGCLGDDRDKDDTGPSACDSQEPQERGIKRAMSKVYASFYNRNAYLERLRRGVDESKVGMAMLVHYSYPDSGELANGVATFTRGEYSANASIVTQAGAVSVANPEGTATPEIVTGYLWSQGTEPSMSTTAESSLVPIGGHVMTWPNDYVELFGLLDKVEKKWVEMTGRTGRTLDVEYKKMAWTMPADGMFQVKQVREVPVAASGTTVDTFLIGGDAEWCTLQGEYGDVFGMHRAKVRISAAVKTGFVKEFQDDSWLSSIRIEFIRAGQVRTLEYPGADVTDVAFSRDGDNVTMSFKSNVDEEELTWSIVAPLPLTRDKVAGPLYSADDAMSYWSQIQISSSRAMPWLDWDGTVGQRTDETSAIASCQAHLPIGPDHSLIERDYQLTGGRAFDIAFWWPPAPSGITAGYTAPLVSWERTVISGFTTEPVELNSWWSRSHRPGHHNFSEDFAFEPRLEPGIDANTLAELEAADIAAVYVMNMNTYEGDSGGPICIEHLDGTMTCETL